MPKKIEFKKKGNSYSYIVKPLINERSYLSSLRLPAELSRMFKDKKLKVTIEPID